MFKNLTVKAEVEPKKGRLVVFDCGLIHAGNYPVTNNPRVIINFNFIYK
jgi:ectoine hydroxylase-related dioxygenase (phytanoyl-CoA dioxygenase family)